MRSVTIFVTMLIFTLVIHTSTNQVFAQEDDLSDKYFLDESEAPGWIITGYLEESIEHKNKYWNAYEIVLSKYSISYTPEQVNVFVVPFDSNDQAKQYHERNKEDAEKYVSLSDSDLNIGAHCLDNISRAGNSEKYIQADALCVKDNVYFLLTSVELADKPYRNISEIGKIISGKIGNNGDLIDRVSDKSSDFESSTLPKNKSTNEFKKFQNTRFVIQYPINWDIDDEVVDLGVSDAFISGTSFVAFCDDCNDWESLLDVRLWENEQDAMNYSGDSYLDYLIGILRDDCTISSFEVDGYVCSSHSVTNSEIIEINGRQAYKVTETWTETYPNQDSYQNLRIIVDIPVGDDVWSLDLTTVSSEYSKHVEIIDKMINSFKIIDPKNVPDKNISENKIMADTWNYKADIVDHYISTLNDPKYASDQISQKLHDQGKKLSEKGTMAGSSAGGILLLAESIKTSFDFLIDSRTNFEIVVMLINEEPSLIRTIDFLEDLRQTFRDISDSYERNDLETAKILENDIQGQINSVVLNLDSLSASVKPQKDYRDTITWDVGTIGLGEPVSKEFQLKNNIKNISFKIIQYPKHDPLSLKTPVYSVAYMDSHGNPRYGFSIDGDEGTTKYKSPALPVSVKTHIDIIPESFGSKGFFLFGTTPIKEAHIKVELMFEYGASIDQKWLDKGFHKIIENLKSDLDLF